MDQEAAARSVLAAFDRALHIVTTPRLTCPYCAGTYTREQSVQHLLTERCLAAQIELRGGK